MLFNSGNFELAISGALGFSSVSTKLTDSLFDKPSFDTAVGNVVRTCQQLMKVRVYRNLNKPEYYSILAMEGVDKGKVIAYAKSVLLENVTFRVSEASRQRVLKDQRRNVHAFCEGIIVDASNTVQNVPSDALIVTYNPYRGGSFYRKVDGADHVKGCTQAMLQGSNVHVLESA